MISALYTAQRGYNTIDFLQNPHKTHFLARPSGSPVFFVSVYWDICSDSVNVVLYGISHYSGVPNKSLCLIIYFEFFAGLHTLYLGLLI